MPFSKVTGDLPKIIANQERLYEGSLTFYFRTLFFKSSNIYNPYHCRPVKQAVSVDKGMILHAILAN